MSCWDATSSAPLNFRGGRDTCNPICIPSNCGLTGGLACVPPLSFLSAKPQTARYSIDSATSSRVAAATSRAALCRTSLSRVALAPPSSPPPSTFSHHDAHLLHLFARERERVGGLGRGRSTGIVAAALAPEGKIQNEKESRKGKVELVEPIHRSCCQIWPSAGARKEGGIESVLVQSPRITRRRGS